MNPGNNRNNNIYNLDVQVWWPSRMATTDGCYRLVGSRRFNSVVLHRGIARVTLQSEERIPFQFGDVLGFYVENSGQNKGGVMALTDLEQEGDGGFQTEQVWYGNIDNVFSLNSACPYPVGSNGILHTFTNAAPVISVAMSEYKLYCDCSFTLNPNQNGSLNLL